jgi:predicted enzyme related to lactoylglutathione lyase
VTAAGGSVIVRENVPTVGDFAVIRDPQTAVISVFKPTTSMKPHDPAKPGEFNWAELYTTDAPKALAFFSDLVGWEKIQEYPIPPMGQYYIFGIGGVSKGGIMNLPPGMKTPDGRDVPPSWMFYVCVADLDASLERAKTLGATVINGPMPVPGGQRIVQMIDPFGAAFAMSSPPVSTNG